MKLKGDYLFGREVSLWTFKSILISEMQNQTQKNKNSEEYLLWIGHFCNLYKAHKKNRIRFWADLFKRETQA